MCCLIEWMDVLRYFNNWNLVFKFENWVIWFVIIWIVKIFILWLNKKVLVINVNINWIVLVDLIMSFNVWVMFLFSVLGVN